MDDDVAQVALETVCRHLCHVCRDEEGTRVEEFGRTMEGGGEFARTMEGTKVAEDVRTMEGTKAGGGCEGEGSGGRGAGGPGPGSRFPGPRFSVQVFFAKDFHLF